MYTLEAPITPIVQDRCLRRASPVEESLDRRRRKEEAQQRWRGLGEYIKVRFVNLSNSVLEYYRPLHGLATVSVIEGRADARTLRKAFSCREANPIAELHFIPMKRPEA